MRMLPIAAIAVASALCLGVTAGVHASAEGLTAPGNTAAAAVRTDAAVPHPVDRHAKSAAGKVAPKPAKSSRSVKPVHRSTAMTATKSGGKHAAASSLKHAASAHGGQHHGAAIHPVAKVAAVAAAVTAAAVPLPSPVLKGADSGLPLPRFAALRSDQVSLRAGPGTRYPIDWVYQRRYLPVRIEREFEVWRLISEPDGTKGWVHEAMLTGRRGFLITGDQPRTLRAAANASAQPVAVLKPGVVGRLKTCPAGNGWCQVEVKGYSGWLERGDFWGAVADEVVLQ